MSLKEDIGGAVQAARVTSNGTAVSQGVTVRQIHYADSGTAGTLVLRDGGSGGTIIAELTTAGDSSAHTVTFPGAGMDFNTDVYVEVNNTNGVTVWYQ